MPKSGYKSVKWLFGKYEEIPEEWESGIVECLTRLDEKSSIRMGPFGSSLKSHELLDSGNIKTLWIENIVNDEFTWNHQKFISEKKYEELKGFTVKPNDIIITMMGTLGRVAIVPKDIGTAIISSHLLKISLDPKKAHPSFLFYVLKSHFISRQIIKEARGLVMGGLNTGIIKKLQIHIPPLNEQQKIASILSNVDKLISSYDDTIQTTKKLKQGLMQQLLTKGIDHTKFKKVPWLFGKEIEIPEEWEIKKIKDITTVSVGLVINPSTYFDENGTIPMITGKNVTEKGIVLDNVDCITEKSNELLETTRIWSGDLVTMRVGYPGRTSVVKEENDGMNCASVIITRKSKKIISEFLGFLANSRLISRQVTMHQAGGAQQVVNVGSWKEFLITYPPIDEQQKIASILSSIDDKITELESKKKSLESLKKGLMQKLLTGQIRVSV